MGLFAEAKLRLVGDRGVLIEYGDAIAPEINRKVRAMSLAVKEASGSSLSTRAIINPRPRISSIRSVRALIPSSPAMRSAAMSLPRSIHPSP